MHDRDVWFMEKGRVLRVRVHRLLFELPIVDLWDLMDLLRPTFCQGPSFGPSNASDVFTPYLLIISSPSYSSE